jgi:hypothetical protein
MKSILPLRLPLLLTLLAGGIADLAAQERAPVEPLTLPLPDQEMAPVKPSVEKLDESRYRIGTIIFDQKTREIRFPASVNMSEGLLEFAIVHENGKIHEALLLTDISALQLNLAFKLLRYPASEELYLLPNDRGGLSDKFPEVPEEVSKGARIDLSVEWEDAGRTRKVPLNEWIQHAVKGSTMSSGPWVYGGSLVHEGRFAAEVTGDIAAIFITNSALINYPGTDNRDDTVWLVYPKRVPEAGTKVTVIIAPHQDAKPIPAK